MTQTRNVAPQRHADMDDAAARQAQAADPACSVWVNASAGSGKTKVLIDRVLRLMLPRATQAAAPTAPEKILCLTFTKAAAAEMSNRIYDRLAAWAVGDDATLDAELRALTGGAVDAPLRAAARRLFARVLDTPGGMKIMTLHSFCQSVLKRFPIEAGLPAHFRLMEENAAAECLIEGLHAGLAEAREGKNPALGAAFARLALHVNAEEMIDLLRGIAARGGAFRALLEREGGVGGALARLHRQLGIKAEEDEGTAISRVHARSAEDEQGLRRALRALEQGKTSDVAAARRLRAWLEHQDLRGEYFADYRRVFFTVDDTPRGKLATSAAVALCPDIVNILEDERVRVKKSHEHLKRVRFAALNRALLILAGDMLARYAARKAERDALDYEDLITRTGDLVADRRMTPWVLFKLDEGIDHILVDEAQDTSPGQWRIVAALADEFFNGEGARADTERTLFVVGDDKQSIFSFQGADPDAFARMRAWFGGRIGPQPGPWEVPLDHSFRSARAVLTAVDAVFAAPAAARGVSGSAVRHRVIRVGMAGAAEIWPLVKTEKSAPRGVWDPPTGIETAAEAEAVLAERIAATLRGWLDNGEMLPARGRPVRAGDVLILVQSRRTIVGHLMRALKKHRVPVAGFDRVRLTEEMAVMDLLALARFALLPEDDLTLATVLKSPLIGLGEDELFALCQGRADSLWRVLRQHRPDLAAALAPHIAAAGAATPYEFFSRALHAPCFADSISGRRALYARLGPDSEDAVEELLNISLSYEQDHTPSLQAFVDWFSRGDAEIKREQESAASDVVRILTVHGAKGLQAPIVFLADASKKSFDHARARPRLLWPEDGGLPLWAPSAAFAVPEYDALQQAARARRAEEYRRLLYVAMTRAEDRLIITGYESGRAVAEDCWYRLAEAGFPVADADGVRRIISPQEGLSRPDARADDEARSRAVATPLPGWIHSAPPPEPVPPRPLTPSRREEEDDLHGGPRAAAIEGRYRKGVLLHRILEFLPSVPAAARAETLQRYLARTGAALPPETRDDFARRLLALVEEPKFARLFGPGSRAEVAVTAVADGQAMAGQIDRLVVDESGVWIVDYKTNRIIPARGEDTPPAYLRQLAAYARAVRLIYPDKPISCSILWTEGPELMNISEKLIDSFILR